MATTLPQALKMSYLRVVSNWVQAATTIQQRARKIQMSGVHLLLKCRRNLKILFDSTHACTHTHTQTHIHTHLCRGQIRNSVTRCAKGKLMY